MCLLTHLGFWYHHAEPNRTRPPKTAYAISQQHTAYKSYIKAFLDSASIETVENEEVIHAKVAEKNMIVSEQIIRTILQLNDKPAEPYMISE
ncbi:hypothetical protein Hanom_Chr00s000048g01617601 [Helianthus anomalus]